MISGYLPDTSNGGHLLITSRDPNSTGTSVEGLEVGVLEPSEATDLLLVRANLLDQSKKSEVVEVEALKIVVELGLLALAIEQDAAFIPEKLKDIFKFLPLYADLQVRRAFLQQIPTNGGNYSRSVATTWLLSFEEVQKRNAEAAQLLQIFSFLNPDGILIEFLEAGRVGLPSKWRELEQTTFTLTLMEALADLERFSLIRRSEGGLVVVIHRLVQYVIKDTSTNRADDVISLCDAAFPSETVLEGGYRVLCRKFQWQVAEPLLAAVLTQSSERAANVMIRVGDFLRTEGKFAVSRRLLSKACEIHTELMGEEHANTLTGLNKLASLEIDLGRNEEATA